MTFEQVVRWLRTERVYQRNKFGDYEVAKGKGADYWEQQVGQYLHRATVLGYETPVGLQAMMKAVATAMAMAEIVSREHGPPPPPGVPSGEIKEG